MTIDILDLRKQLAFYGAYHSHPTNVLIHIVFVPILVWTALVFTTGIPLPDFIPNYSHVFTDYLRFDLNFPAILTTFYIVYYYLLEPFAALLYTPQLLLFLLTATSVSYTDRGTQYAVGLHIIGWVAQFIGHAYAEKRAPALLDNLVGAVALAPFFVHIELLFKLGYRPSLQKDLKNDIGKEIQKIRAEESKKKKRNKAN